MEGAGAGGKRLAGQDLSYKEKQNNTKQGSGFSASKGKEDLAERSPYLKKETGRNLASHSAPEIFKKDSCRCLPEPPLYEKGGEKGGWPTS